MKRIPHTFTIVFGLIVLAAVLTWVVPAGEFLRQTVDGREVVVSNSFHFVDRAPQTWQIFSAFFNGFVDKADIIIFILMVGGAFWILNNSHAIDVGVMAFLRRVQRLSRYKLISKLGVDNIIITLVMLGTALGCLIACLAVYERMAWSGYVVIGEAFLYVTLVLPFWFRRYYPAVFIPLSFLALGGYLVYINAATGGHWFLPFAFPVTGMTFIVT